jgi:acetyltransferase-like isoleucine patch superfamily enzyme
MYRSPQDTRHTIGDNMLDIRKTGEITGRWPYGNLPPNVCVGQNCFFERRDSFGRFRSERNPGLVIGDRVRVYTWTTFNIEPAGTLEIGDDTILVGAVFMCAQRVSVGRRVVVSYNVTIADSDFHPLDPEMRKQDAIANAPFGDRSSRPPIVRAPVSIGDDVWIGIGAMILKGVQIGDGARIGPGAVVTSNVPVGAMVIGNPARVVQGLEFS